MKIKTKEFLKTLEGKSLELTIGEALSNILLSTETGGKMKMFVLAEKVYKDKEVDLDSADLGLVKQSVENTKIYNNLVAGQLLVLLEKADK